MMYLDNGATSFPKPAGVVQAMAAAMARCTNPGRGGYPMAEAAAEVVYGCRERASRLFHCQPEQVVLTGSCTHGLNLAIRTLVRPGDKVLISGFEHNAVVRPLHLLGAETVVAGRRLFDWEDTLTQFAHGLKQGVSAAVFTHCSNVFGYVLPVEEMAALCRQHGVPFVVDAAQSAGALPVDMESWGADFIAMSGHKGLLGPQGTGLLLCNRLPAPLLAGGTGSDSKNRDMPPFLPDRAEAGTMNVPGIAGLDAGIHTVQRLGVDAIGRREHQAAKITAAMLKRLGFSVFSGPHQAGTVSFIAGCDCEEAAEKLSRQGVAVRSGLHCAPLAHESAGTLETGTVRISFGRTANADQVAALEQAIYAAGLF